MILLALVCLPLNAAQTPKNVILMIGDGMGPAQVTLARLSQNGTPLSMDSMHYGGLVKTHSANATITDSAAAGTALATGYKTNNGMISTLPDGTQVQTILEAAMKLGKAAGLVTTTTITNATPAVFGSHVESRSSEADIALQYLDEKINVLIGGGRMYFMPQTQEGSKRADDRDLLAEARKAGYSIAATRDELLAVKSGKLLGLLQMSSLTTESPEPTLAEMASEAIEILRGDPDGFFLMIEGGQIDWKCHSNLAADAVKQIDDFDAAIKAALDFARQRKDTLVIVTADHETGGLTILYPDESGKTPFTTSWATKGHSGCSVPILADGPGADDFSGILDNTDVPKRIAHLWGIKGFANGQHLVGSPLTISH
jgi:alkaline phosphatase